MTPAPQSAGARTRDRLLLGTIGHVDHGKTALVRALTGMETDRLPEERRRGISIALGFAHMKIGEAEIDIIDMPGHERFVRTMVSGATGIHAVLLVVAANEGIKPQTVEHIDIAGLLGLRRAVIAVSKSDLVTREAAEATARAAEALLARAGLTTAAMVLTSSHTGEGVDNLKGAIARLLPQLDEPADDGFPHLPIDRAFSLAGHGTVVTGTLRHGSLSVSDALELVPSGRAVRLRGLHVHGARVTTAYPGQRVAANLRGVEVGEVARGAALAAPGLLTPARWISVQLRAVASTPPIRTTMRLQLLFGTEEIEARLRLLDRDTLEPGDMALAQLHCAAPIAVPARERFILRTASPARTVAGGRVVDPDTRREPRHVAAPIARIAALADATPDAIIAREIEATGACGIALDRVARIAGVAPARAMEVLLGMPVVVGRARVAVARAVFDTVSARLLQVLAEHPAGLAREAVSASLPDAGPEVVNEAVSRLIAGETIAQESGTLRIPRPALERDAAERRATKAAQLAEVIRRGGLTPPDVTTIAAEPHARRLLDMLVREGVVIRTHDRMLKRDIVFHREAVAAAQRRLAPLLTAAPGLLVSEAGAALGISRKFSVPLLEYFDAIHFTRRAADRRVLARTD